jgi:hypothetical protein
MAFAGQSEDAIALYYGLHKNTLRARFAHALDRGRDRARKAIACDLTREEKCALNSILSAFASQWHQPGGNLLWRGINRDSATSPADAFAAWVLAGRRFICTGLDDDFSRERLQEFAAVKAEAQELLAAKR